MQKHGDRRNQVSVPANQRFHLVHGVQLSKIVEPAILGTGNLTHLRSAQSDCAVSFAYSPALCLTDSWVKSTIPW